MPRTYKQIPIYIPDLFKSIVEEVGVNINDEISTAYSQAMASDSGTVPNIELRTQFIPGTILEILERLSEKNDSPKQKEFIWPMVGLIHNFKESFGKEGIYNETQLTLWICHLSDQNSTYTDRYTKVFKTVLYPIWLEMMSVIQNSYKFSIDEITGVEYGKIDRPKWGRYQDLYGNYDYELNEFIDGIELQLTLKINNDNCLNHSIEPQQIKFLN
jgi:hypothetical protein